MSLSIMLHLKVRQDEMSLMMCSLGPGKVVNSPVPTRENDFTTLRRF